LDIPLSVTYDNSTGVELTVTRHRCGTTSPGLDLFGPTVTRLQFAFPAEYSPPYLNIPVNRSSLYQATTFAICYCPAADGNCNSPSTFTQQIGLLMLYDVRVCSPIEGLSCISDFSAVVAGQGSCFVFPVHQKGVPLGMPAELSLLSVIVLRGSYCPGIRKVHDMSAR